MDLSRLLRPRTIAVIGGAPAAEVVRQNDRLGFAGTIWPVHPTRAEIFGRATVRDIADLPAAPDAVFLAVNRTLTVELVARLAAMGAGGVVSYASGFAEADAEGVALQAALRAAAGTMPVLGPNCYGTINYLDGAALWPDQHGGVRVERGVALVTQSGNIGLNLTMQRRGLPLAYIGTLGNQAVVGMAAMISALSRDPRISAIGLHIEGLDDPPAFAAAVAEAATRGVRVVAVKTGASAAGAALTVTHTASMTGPDAIADAFLRRAGVARVRTLPELLETLKLLHVHGTLAGPEIASLSCSGGEAALAADRAEGRRVHFRPFTPAQKAVVEATVPALVTVSNPFDYHTFHWNDREALTRTFTAVMRADFAMMLLVLDYPRADRGDDAAWSVAAAALAEARRLTGAAAGVLATLPENLSEQHAAALMAEGIAPLCGIDEALVALDAALALPPGPPPHPAPALGGVARTLDEQAGKQLLSAYGVPVPHGRRGAGADWDRFPAVVKALGLDHKTERCAVRLNLPDAAAVDDAAAALAPLGDGVLVEEMVTGGVAELIVGVVRDPCGFALLLGSGGVLAELVADRATLMMPASAAEIRTALGSLRVAGLLAGHRGRPAGDMAAAVAAILAIQDAALAHADSLVELDVNPLIVTTTRAVAADVLIRLVQEPAP